MNYRIERDSIGEREIPLDAYYGVQSLRGHENFHITGRPLIREYIESLAEIKTACARTNFACGELEKNECDAIVQACREILEGKFHDQFICDSVQGSAGTTINMNANEVIANRAIEILGGKKGDYSIIHPNDHVNRSQSTNDVIPTAGKMTAIKLMKHAIFQMNRLEQALAVKEREFWGVIKMGRTEMQDAVPIRLGQEFGAYRHAVKRGISRLEFALSEMSYVNMGATAIGTCINAPREYVETIVPTLSLISGLKLKQCEDLVDGTQNLDSFAFVSSILKTVCGSLAKMCHDLMLMSSGPRTGFGEIRLPSKQNGSSIMPGKVNPVVPEAVCQISYMVAGNDTTIHMAVESGQLELNAYEPVIFYKLFESIKALTGGVETLVDNCIIGIEANEDRCRYLVENSIGIITPVAQELGYQTTADVAKEALRTGKSVRDLLKSKHMLSDEEVDQLLDIRKMV
ncbi:MAG: aspartate ammonia-lyase [Lachnospiraceae bacterium]|nr:aspartate ammonia-lyase [Lachnospiraceae bacterium]